MKSTTQELSKLKWYVLQDDIANQAFNRLLKPTAAVILLFVNKTIFS